MIRVAKQRKPREKMYDPVLPSDIPDSVSAAERQRMVGRTDPANKRKSVMPQIPKRPERKNLAPFLPSTRRSGGDAKRAMPVTQRPTPPSKVKIALPATPRPVSRPRSSLPSTTSPRGRTKVAAPVLERPQPVSRGVRSLGAVDSPSTSSSRRTRVGLESTTGRSRGDRVGGLPSLRSDRRSDMMLPSLSSMLIPPEPPAPDAMESIGFQTMGITGITTADPFAYGS